MSRSMWRCPLCGGGLTEKQGTSGTLCCEKNHCFDRAREGYYHLLPVQEMRTKAPGDSRDMVAARHAFLNAGFYGPFGTALGRLCLQYGTACPGHGEKRAGGPPLRVLDAGCGEGWYDSQIAAAFAEKNRPLALSGFDIAKPAVRLAAKGLPTGQYAVASSFAIPAADGCADVLLNIFSPFAHSEFLRVLRPGGRLIYAVPGENHLFEMKQVLYDTPYKNPVQQVEYEGFRTVGEQLVESRIAVPQEMLENLFAMTPYYWKTPKIGAERLRGLERLATDISFRFLVFEKE